MICHVQPILFEVVLLIKQSFQRGVCKNFGAWVLRVSIMLILAKMTISHFTRFLFCVEVLFGSESDTLCFYNVLKQFNKAKVTQIILCSHACKVKKMQVFVGSKFWVTRILIYSILIFLGCYKPSPLKQNLVPRFKKS